MALIAVSALHAQYKVDTGDNKIVVTGKDGQQIINVAGELKTDRLSVEVLGMKLQLRNSDREEEARPAISKARLDRGHLAFLEIGYNYTMNHDYYYLDMIGAENYGFMERKDWRSLQVAVALTKISFDLDRSGSSSLLLGIQAVFNSYMLPDNIMLEKKNGMIIPVKMDEKFKKSYMYNLGFRFPIMFEVNAQYGLFVSWGAYIDVLTGNAAITRKPNTEMTSHYLNPVQAGVSMKIGWRGYYVYMNGSVTNLFKDGRGPMFNSATIGIGVDF